MACGQKQRLSPQDGCGMVDVGCSSAQGGVVDSRMAHQVVFQIHDRRRPPDEQQTVVVVQLPNLVRGQQLSAGHLKVRGPGASPALCLAVGLCVDGGFPEHFGNVFVR